MEMQKRLLSAAMMGVVALMLQTPEMMRAQGSQPAPDGQTSQNDQDPPGRVARLNYIDGSVSLQPAGESDWVDATLNRPLVTGDNLWADENSRAELHVGSTALRLGEKTGITLLEVGDQTVQIRLAMGSLIVNVRHVDGEDSYEIDTPNIAFVVTQPGDYRVDVSPDDYRTEVTVWRGRGEVTGGGSVYTIGANQYASFTGSDRLDYGISQIPGNDALDAWASERDRREDDSDSAEYVSSDMTGYEDLGAYGDWTYICSIRLCLASRRHGTWMGALPLWPLDLGRSLGLDLGGRRAVGFRAISLRTLGTYGKYLGLGSGVEGCAPGLCARACWLGRRWGLESLSGMVSISSGRSVRSGLQGQRRLRKSREHHQHQRDRNASDERLQHGDRESKYRGE